jgi:hypothetical protein
MLFKPLKWIWLGEDDEKMPRQEDIDTAPVIMKDDTHVTFESIELAPGDRAEIVLAPRRPVVAPVLFVSSTQKDSSIVIEQIVHGDRAESATQVFGGETLGSQIPGSQTLGSQTLGSQTLGSQTLGSQTLGSQTLSLDSLRFGRQLDLIVTENEPIKILVANSGRFKTTVGASLVTNSPESKTTYQLSGDKIVQDKG